MCLLRLGPGSITTIAIPARNAGVCSGNQVEKASTSTWSGEDQAGMKRPCSQACQAGSSRRT